MSGLAKACGSSKSPCADTAYRTGKFLRSSRRERPADSRALLRVFAVRRTPLACFVVILERDHEALERAQRREPGDEDERPPEHRVYPVRRLIEELNGECGARDDEARDEHGKERGRVRRIGEGEIEAAAAAVRRESQKAG